MNINSNMEQGVGRTIIINSSKYLEDKAIDYMKKYCNEQEKHMKIINTNDH